ncbi:MAG: hypothetical protein J0J01_19930 [Reyranella sp.]|uniref:hypothetical protein n=1 Tax=Reyranella sp. TaxID=1929291 RepID=UPI001ACCB5BE|nr:hypothetical protein [Reyranella sp.]MBN9089182.1 hypothetical protein [Reyranella sp.]
MRGPSDRAAAPALDLSRLKKATASLGYQPPAGVGAGRQLQRINRDLGERLARGPARERAAVAQALAEADAALPADIRTPHGGVQAADVERLRQTGCLDLGSLLSGGQAGDIQRHLAAKPLLVGRAPDRSEGQAASLEAVPSDRHYACHGHLDLWSSPHLLEVASQDKVLDLVQGYLGCTPTLYALNAFWALPDRPADPQRQSFHRDLEDFRSLALFTLLTPVEAPEEGGHYYVEGSHDAAILEAALRADGADTKIDYLISSFFIPSLAMRLFHRTARHFHGQAGATLCADPYGLHRSVAPRQRPQLLLEIRFGTFFNERLFDMKIAVGARHGLLQRALAPLFGNGPSSGREQARQILQRLPATPRHRYVFRHMVRALSAA